MSFEYQVVLLAIDTLNAKLSPIDENLPHSMLPVANRPLLSYQLELLERAGFKSVLIVIQEFQQTKITPYVTQIYKETGKIEVEFFVLKDQNQIGTCEILYRIREKIRTNFIVMNGNLIADEGFIRQMADLHRSSDSSLTILLNKAEINPKEKLDASFIDYIGLDENNNRVLLMESATEIEEKVLVSKNLLKYFPNITLNVNLKDTQFYIFSRWVIDLIVEDQKNNKNNPMTSIKKQLIPYLLSCQIPGHGRNLPASAINHNQDLALSMSTSSTPFNPSYHINQQTQGTIKCMNYLMNGYCININNLQTFTQANRDIASGKSSTYKPLEAPFKNNYIDTKAQVAPTSIGINCVIGTETILGQKSSVKNSIIGKHCKFGTNVRIDSSIIMDYVTVEDQCNISGSIIGNNVYIKTKFVKDSQVSSGFTVTKDLKGKQVGNSSL
ncbi:eukaryotic translation initiation factor 2B [Heterostelium album PN500]|uniref:Translation initiation factor eIF2B subunit gamma n=1 Tax=Heterostelium pallidum (strain ATCC 26659 / Pp 5 / PN500) TaxID=670386 RepID=D3B9E9_HETP5|nr:eukaryotic translation initiation factor 2B [Heterostelium album PN500]EFA81861.1 eukaryotic translation initiation factor 2B [Heterostelium album PN500]|eukprot:XP_020433978.1 eukaryotic translation initiation factor 2B [Heterostelium album PN500]